MKIDEPLIGKAGQDTDWTHDEDEKELSEWGYDKEGDLIPKLKFAEIRQSDWEVKLWGNDSFIMRPAYGDEPNRWIRFWMKIFFNSKWSKV